MQFSCNLVYNIFPEIEILLINRKGLPFPANPWYLWRAIRDDFKTSVENLVQEMFGQIAGILALDAIPNGV